MNPPHPANVKTRPQRRHRVAIVAYNDLRTFEYSIAAEMFGLERPSLGVAWYESVVVSPDRGALLGVGGMRVRPNAPLEAMLEADTVVIPGWRDVETPAPRKFCDALSAAHARGARLLSICSGSFALADAGLLNGRTATTHWLFAETFKRRFPKVEFSGDVLYVDHGDVITSAGSAAGIDACLHVIRKDYGAAVANTIAKRMVVAPHREGGQAQYVETPVSARESRGVGVAMQWAGERLHEPIGVPQMAARCAMSARTFLRRFHDAAGMPPHQWLQQARLARARELLETTVLSHDQVAAECGYETLDAFRLAFRRVVGVAPGAYRARFAQRTS